MAKLFWLYFVWDKIIKNKQNILFYKCQMTYMAIGAEHYSEQGMNGICLSKGSFTSTVGLSDYIFLIFSFGRNNVFQSPTE